MVGKKELIINANKLFTILDFHDVPFNPVNEMI